MTVRTTMTIAREVDGVEVEYEIEVEGTAVPLRRGTYCKPNGDPGDPPEGGYIEDVRVVWSDGPSTESIKLNEFELEDAMIELWDAAHEED
jgi:hypothetical protein